MQDNIIFQKYRYIKSLGHGGCAEVFLAENIALKNNWAIKEINKNRTTSISGYLEPVILRRLNHPALPRIVDVHEDENKIYIIEDYIDGKSLLQVLEHTGPCEEQVVIDWAMQLCSVLEYLHGQKPDAVIYGDMKPHNIILTQDGCIKLIDFGVSMYSANEKATGSKAIGTEASKTGFIGTRGYAAPEQYLGKGSAVSTDIYSLGITLIQLLTGLHPLQCADFYSDTEYKECMSSELFGILHKCVQPKPSMRYSSVSRLRKDIGRIALYNVSRPPGANIGINNLTRIFAFSGVRGTGVSTITAAVAEYLATTSKTRVCIVDLSHTGTLAKCMAIEKPIKTKPIKLDTKLFYINYRDFTSPDLKSESDLKEYPIDHTDPLIIYKQFSQLQDQFSFILIDADLSILKMIEHIVSHIFLVCDMNPYYMAGLWKRIEVKELASTYSSGTSFIINKFYKGELSSYDILQCTISNNSTDEFLRKLVSLSNLFEVPYDQWIYLKWMYSGFGEPLKFGGKLRDRFGMAVAHIVDKTIQPPKSQPWQWFRKNYRSGVREI